MKHPILLLLILLTCVVANAQKYTANGYITDKSTGEPLIWANIYDRNSGKGTQTNNFGFYSLSLFAKDTIFLRISYIGYTTKNTKIVLTTNQTIC